MLGTRETPATGTCAGAHDETDVLGNTHLADDTQHLTVAWSWAMVELCVVPVELDGWAFVNVQLNCRSPTWSSESYGQQLAMPRHDDVGHRVLHPDL